MSTPPKGSECETMSRSVQELAPFSTNRGAAAARRTSTVTQGLSTALRPQRTAD